MLKRAYSILLISALLITAAIGLEAAEILTGRIKIEDNIATITTGEREISLYVTQPEFIADKPFPFDETGEYQFHGFATEKGYIIHEITTLGREGSLKSESGKPLLLSTDQDISYSIDPRRCISCRFCIEACPVNAISMRRGVAIIDQDRCISCGICLEGNQTDYEGCPVGAVRADEKD